MPTPIKLRLTRPQTRRLLTGLCVYCGYDVRASPSRCPECGYLRPELSDIDFKTHQTIWSPLLLPIALVVLAIFIAMSAPIVTFDNGHRDAKKKAAMADISTIKDQLQAFHLDTGRYPTTAEGLNILVTNAGYLPGWTHAYLDKMPIDPWQHPYVYQQPGKNGQPFDLFSCGPDGQPGTADDIHIN